MDGGLQDAFERIAGEFNDLRVEAVLKALFDANTMLYATTDNTPAALAVAASRIVGRKATGDIDDLTTAELAALFGTPDGTKFLADDGTLKTPAGGGGGAALTVQNEGVDVDTAVDEIDFLGAGVDVADDGTGRVEVTVLGDIETYVFSVPGQVYTGTGKARIYMEGNRSVLTVRASVNTAPTGATLISDVNKNGTTIYTTQGNRPTIATSGFTATANSPDVTTFASGDYMTADVDQVGSTVAGADLTITVRVRVT